MSYLNQNYFNNFQVRQPLLKNPINRAPPQQLIKSRPAVCPTGNYQITVEDLEGAAFRINDTLSTASVYTLPTANRILRELGTQSNGNPTPQWSCLTNTGDCLFINVINKGFTGTVVANGEGGSTGVVVIPANSIQNASVLGGNTGAGRRYGMTIEFTNIGNGPNGVTGTYICY
jgi:hypothetical protein